MAYEKDREPDYDEKITIRIDRRLAEDLYYDLLLGLGGRDYSEGTAGKTGKSGGKSYAAPYDRQS
jgi:hypothetical protein